MCCRCFVLFLLGTGAVAGAVKKSHPIASVMCHDPISGSWHFVPIEVEEDLVPARKLEARLGQHGRQHVLRATATVLGGLLCDAARGVWQKRRATSSMHDQLPQMHCQPLVENGPARAADIARLPIVAALLGVAIGVYKALRKLKDKAIDGEGKEEKRDACSPTTSVTSTSSPSSLEETPRSARRQTTVDTVSSINDDLVPTRRFHRCVTEPAQCPAFEPRAVRWRDGGMVRQRKQEFEMRSGFYKTTPDAMNAVNGKPRVSPCMSRQQSESCDAPDTLSRGQFLRICSEGNPGNVAHSRASWPQAQPPQAQRLRVIKSVKFWEAEEA